MEIPDPDVIVKHLFEVHGGKEKFFETAEADHAELLELWNQGTGAMGRILRAHLFLEHYIERALIQRNPNLGSLERARLTFYQKVELLSGDGSFKEIDYLLPGIRRLNSVRNRMVHTLHAEVTREDADAFLAIGLFRAMREQSAAPDTPSTDPLEILEGFAKHAGIALQHVATGQSKSWTEAYRRAQAEVASQ